MQFIATMIIKKRCTLLPFISKNSKDINDSVSKTNKGYFFTFYSEKSPDVKPTVSGYLNYVFLLKTAFYKKHPIDVPQNWSYHYFRANHTYVKIRILGTFQNKEASNDCFTSIYV
jgi:hypothetical protein